MNNADWISDPSLSEEEKLATYEALPDGGNVVFADPLMVEMYGIAVPAAALRVSIQGNTIRPVNEETA